MTEAFRSGRPISVQRYSDLFEGFEPEELRLIPQLKRFFECYEGDRELRTNLEAGMATAEQLALLREIGITFDVDELSPLWKDKRVFEDALMNPEESDPKDVTDLLARSPLLNLWARFVMKKAEMYRAQRHFCTHQPSSSPRYTAWRRRRLAAVRSELGMYGYNIDHPQLAIELAVGCSVGCYFCAFDAKKLARLFDYTVPENRALFRGVAGVFRDRLGWSAGHALLYWSTEPADNPHYIDFLRDYEEITGATLCTATARANDEWVADLIAFYRRQTLPWPRISVLTRSIMYRLHKRFTPEEARDMIMLMQQKDSEDLRTKVPGGRDRMLNQLETYTDLRKLEDVDHRPADLFVPQGSIACVSGFLVNLLDRTVKLISPCYSSRQYPYGYRTFDEATFADVEDFDRVIGDMIDRKMVFEPYPAMPMRFRDDLAYRPKAEGFRLVSPNQVHHCAQDPVYAPLGELIARGTMTYDEVCDELIGAHRFNPMQVVAAIKSLFDEGFLDELSVEIPDVELLAGSSQEMSAAG
ncbi:MAG TPA: radical SAM family RiPP maturation amino acid epimerase [Vicinamibacterales bacterium]|jgi:radical SAM family RiPP maturation amino acid epimerase